jgi:hypothetical protein
MSFQAVCCWLALSESESLATGCDIEDADPVVAGVDVLDFDMPAAEATETPARSARTATLRRWAVFMEFLQCDSPPLQKECLRPAECFCPTASRPIKYRSCKLRHPDAGAFRVANF